MAWQAALDAVGDGVSEAEVAAVAAVSGEQSGGKAADIALAGQHAMRAAVRPGQSGGRGSQTCGGTTNSAGVTSCSPFTITRQETALRYTGQERVANGTSTELSGVLTEESMSGPPVEGRSVTLALGTGENRQACTATTNGDGVTACTIDAVNQPLNADATVPVTVSFDADAFLRALDARDTVLLEYYTGRSYGLEADIGVLGVGVSVAPIPDTGPFVPHKPPGPLPPASRTGRSSCSAPRRCVRRS